MMYDLPFSFQFLDVKMPSSQKSQFQRCVKLVCLVNGIIGIGGMLSVLEGDWEGFPLQTMPSYFREMKCFRLAELLEEVFALFPSEVLNDVKKRSLWTWGKSPGSEHVPDAINALQGQISDMNLTVGGFCISFILDNLHEFPEHFSFLSDYMKRGGRSVLDGV